MNLWENLSQTAAPGFSRLEALLSHLGHPEEGLSVVQVAGTHGKSSVAAFLEAVFQAAGLCVGVCAPPDPMDPWQAVRLRGHPLSPTTGSALLSRALGPWEGLVPGPGKPTAHEAFTALALAHFAQAQADIAILEASTGQRYDPTNFVRPRLVLITQLGAGQRRSGGAWEVATLARPGIPILTTAKEDLEWLARACRQNGAALALLDPEDVELVELSWDRAVWRSRSDPLNLGPFKTRFLGAYQAANLALVLGALAELWGGWPLSLEAVRAGFAQAYIPGGFELVRMRPWVVVDAAQDEVTAQALRTSLAHLPPISGHRALFLIHPEEQLAKEMEAVLRPAFSQVWRSSPEESLDILPHALHLLSEEDFLLIVGPHPVLQEVRIVIQKRS